MEMHGRPAQEAHFEELGRPVWSSARRPDWLGKPTVRNRPAGRHQTVRIICQLWANDRRVTL